MRMLRFKAVLQSLSVFAIVFALLLAPSIMPAGDSPKKASAAGAGEGIIHVNVTDEAGRPMQGANVTIVGNPGFWNFTGADGSLIILNQTVGTFTVNASKTGYLNGSATADVTEFNVTYITITIEGGEFAGFVYAQDNTPIENATIEVAIGSRIIQTLSLPDGSFNLTGIPNGTYIVIVFALGYSATSEVISVTAGFTTIHGIPFKLLAYTGWISGYVFDGTVPVPGASVSIMIDAIEHIVISGTVGDYEIPGVPEGNYTVWFSKEGYIGAEVVNVTVVNGYVTENVNATLVGKPAKVYGSVVATTTEGSVLLPGAVVEILGSGRNATTGTQGTYSISDVPVGTWTIRASAPGYNSNETTGVVITRGAEVLFDIKLSPKPGQLMGTVKDATTRDVLEGYRVSISGPMQRETVTNDRGQYVFAGLEPGNYTLTVTGNSTNSPHSPYIKNDILVTSEEIAVEDVYLQLVKQALGGFIFGLDLAHSFMALAFVITMILLTMAVLIRLKRLQKTEKEMPTVTDAIKETEGEKKPPAQ